MLGLGIRYLNGWAMAAADGARKERAEWPPHPDRVFMALAAAWFETDRDAAEGTALTWLANLKPPSLQVSEAWPRMGSGDRGQRPTTSFVPVNDAKVGRKVPDTSNLSKLKDAGLDVLPEYRSRQPRAFPLVVPQNDTVYLVWPADDAEPHLPALTSLCHKVVSVGHSASFVQMWVDESPPTPNLVPVPGMARHRLRVPGPGRLGYLDARCSREPVVAFADLTERIRAAKGKEKKRLQVELAERFGETQPTILHPEPSLWQGYDLPPPPVAPETRGTVFDPRLIVLTLSGKRLPVTSTPKLMEALRGALMSACPIQPPPEWLTGHAPGGGRSENPHLALMPLPFVGGEHADGRIMGVAIVVPHGLDPAEVGRCIEPILRDEYGVPRRIRLFDGQWFECEVELDAREAPPLNMQSRTWTRISRIWTSVTPVVFDRHFDGPKKWELAADAVGNACERIGLPRPLEVLLQPVSLAEGVPHSREFAHLTRKSDGGRMHHSHVVLVFDQAVRGPVLVGAGRYRGYGVFRPVGPLENGNE